MKKIVFVIILSVSAISAFSQGITALQYSIGFGTGNTHDFINPSSFRGFTVDHRKMIQPNVGVGFDIGWNVFYEKIPDDVYSYGNISYSGKQYRYSNHFPMLAAADYYFKPDEAINPFAGMGLGLMYTLQNTVMGTFGFERTAWHFALRPEIGIMVNTAAGVDLMVTGKYYYGMKAGDLPSQSYFALNFGLVLRRF